MKHIYIINGNMLNMALVLVSNNKIIKIPIIREYSFFNLGNFNFILLSLILPRLYSI